MTGRIRDKNCFYYHGKAFKEIFVHGIPMLCYHKIGRPGADTPLRTLYVSTDLLWRQLREFAAAGYQSISPTPNPPGTDSKKFVLSFDDGFASVHSDGLPILEEHGFRAITFVVSDRIGGWNEWDAAKGLPREKLMDAEQLTDWLERGNWIGAHTRTHPVLKRVPLARAREEVFGGKKKLEDLFQIPVEHFCYPYGSYDPRIVDLVGEAGYQTACTLRPGILTPSTPPLLQHRLSAHAPARNLRQQFHLLASRMFPWRSVPPRVELVEDSTVQIERSAEDPPS